jgi:hypothetical protein
MPSHDLRRHLPLALLGLAAVIQTAVAEGMDGPRMRECGIAIGPGVGCSLQLNDNDGIRRAASAGWGEGLRPAWDPAGFAIVTQVE